MSVRLIYGLLFASAMSCCGFAQQASVQNHGSSITSHATDIRETYVKPGLQQRIATAEATVRQVEAAHASDVDLGRAYWNLGMACEDAAQWRRAEAVLAHSVSLFRRVEGDDRELATALNSVAVIHIGMGELRSSEKEELEALRLREKMGDRLQIAESWSGLAVLSIKQRKYEKARDFARKAVAEFAANPKADESDKVSSQYALGMALCGVKDCASAVPVLKRAVDDARAHFTAQDIPVSMGEFLLGYAHWKSGDMASAGAEMEAGVTAMNEQLGSTHPTYVAALVLYGKYLREAGNVEAANDVESQIRRAEAVVDVHALQSGQAALGFDGLR